MEEALQPLMTQAELATLLRVSHATLSNWRWQKVGPPGFRVGRAVRYRREEVERWLAKQEAAEPQTAS